LVIEEAPERPVAVSASRTSPASFRLMAVDEPRIKKPKQVAEPRLPELVIDTPATPRETEKIARLQPARLHTFGIIYVEQPSRPHAVPPPPPIKIDPAAIAAAKPAPAPAPKEPEAESPDVKITHEDADKTTLQVYFTNGRGKFFTTTPQVLLLDPKSGNLIKRFYRTVDPDGNPDPQTNIPVGTYNLTFSETRGLMVRNVSVEDHKTNKVIVKVNNASLSFEYGDDRTRPVSEFAAVVIERNKPQGRVQNQKCTEKLEYEPGNYHVIINTFPQDVRNLDLDFDEHVIKIAQPGFVKFTAEPGMNSVTLYQRLGDKYLSFHTLNLHDPVAQHLRIQPGEYQAHYHKGPGGPAASEKVVPFIVKPKLETEVELK
jgi:hypothetical protein